MTRKFQIIAIILLGLTLLAGGCSQLTTTSAERAQQALYLLHESGENTLSEKHTPVFLIEDSRKDYNRIGSPAVKVDESGDQTVFVDTEKASVYSMIQNFETDKGSYTNLIYRIHFTKTPLPHLTAGRHAGLLIYVTLNGDKDPVLITTLHTCGCYLAFIPTGHLPEEAKPDDWPEDEQTVYGEILPVLIEKESPEQKVIIKLRSGTHRIIDIGYADPSGFESLDVVPLRLRPMDDLTRLPVPNQAKTVSFFETKGHRKGLVKGSRKPLEMLFMSWWAFDPHVGVDKALGSPEETGATMYTSLKFWDRDESNIWYFRRFLDYWNWDL